MKAERGASTEASKATCPLCRGAGRLRFAVRGIPVHDCLTCGHRFAGADVADDHVSQIYGDDYFEGGGAGYRDYLGEGPLLRAHGRRYGRLLRQLGAEGRLLDVGAAAGFLLQGYLDEGWQADGIEPNARMAAHARNELGLNVACATLEAFPRDRQYDAVTLVQVVAHFVDPSAAFRAVAGLCRPGGLCLIETWNAASWTARAFGRHWHEYSPPSVLHWFTPERLARTLATHGFREVRRGRPRKWLNAGHGKSLLAHRLGGSCLGRAALRLLSLVPDRLAVPYPGDDVFWAVYRKEDNP